MTTDLEAEIRAVMRDRAAAVTPQLLREPDEPGNHGKTPATWRRYVLPALAAAAVIAVVAGLLLFSARPRSEPPDGSIQVAGISWRLVQVARDGEAAVSIPASVGAHVDFGTDGHLGADDGVNAMFGTYHLDGSQLALSNVGSTLVGYDGRDRAVIAAQTGMAAILSGPTASISLHADHLTISAHDYTLTFARGSKLPSHPPSISTTAPPNQSTGTAAPATGSMSRS